MWKEDLLRERFIPRNMTRTPPQRMVSSKRGVSTTSYRGGCESISEVQLLFTTKKQNFPGYNFDVKFWIA
jgi:hypothetical protein